MAIEDFLVHPPAVKVQGEQTVPIFGGPIGALINHHADVRMAASEGIGVAVTRLAPAFAGVEMPVVGVLRTKVVALVIEAMAEQTLMLVPLTLMPGHNAAVLLQVIRVVPLVVQLVSRMGGV